MNITRLWTCSPVATRIGATARAIAACPRMSSGEVGSSIQYGSNSASRAIQAIASSTPQRWFASTAIIASGPISSRTIRARRRSSSTSAPTLSLNRVQPSASASRHSRRILSSS